MHLRNLFLDVFEKKKKKKTRAVGDLGGIPGAILIVRDLCTRAALFESTRGDLALTFSVRGQRSRPSAGNGAHALARALPIAQLFLGMAGISWREETDVNSGAKSVARSGAKGSGRGVSHPASQTGGIPLAGWTGWRSTLAPLRYLGIHS